MGVRRSEDPVNILSTFRADVIGYRTILAGPELLKVDRWYSEGEDKLFEGESRKGSQFRDFSRRRRSSQARGGAAVAAELEGPEKFNGWRESEMPLEKELNDWD